MSLTSESVEHYNPEDALRGFSRTNFVNAVAIALVAHIVLIGGTSTTYIYREMILKRFDPEAYEAMLKEEAEEEQTATEAALGTDGEAEDSEPAAEGEQDEQGEGESEGPASEGGDETEDGADGGDDVPEHAKDSSVVKQRDETAPPPDEPDDDDLGIGINIDDTNL